MNRRIANLWCQWFGHKWALFEVNILGIPPYWDRKEKFRECLRCKERRPWHV